MTMTQAALATPQGMSRVAVIIPARHVQKRARRWGEILQVRARAKSSAEAQREIAAANNVPPGLSTLATSARARDRSLAVVRW